MNFMGSHQRFLKSCPACNGGRIFYWNKKQKDNIDYFIWRCRDCFTGFLNPRPTEEYLKSIYLHSYQGDINEMSLESILKSEEEYPNASIDALRIIKQAHQFLAGNNNSLQALDIGSGYGFFSKAAKELGFSVTAVNPSSSDNRIFEQMNGFRPIAHFFEEVDFQGEQFQLVILSQVLEHLDDPYKNLLKIKKLITENGIVAIAVPSIESFLVRLYGVRENSSFWVPRHVTFFSKKGMVSLLERSGFKMIKYCFMSRIPYNMLSDKLKLRGPARYFANQMVKFLQIPFNHVVDRFGLGIYVNLWAQRR